MIKATLFFAAICATDAMAQTIEQERENCLNFGRAAMAELSNFGDLAGNLNPSYYRLAQYRDALVHQQYWINLERKLIGHAKQSRYYSIEWISNLAGYVDWQQSWLNSEKAKLARYGIY